MVYSGNLTAVAKILQKQPNLAFVQTDIKDLSNREFKRMSGFQYAVWSLDSEMWTLMLQYVDNKRAAYQFHELQHDRLDITNYHDLHIDFDPLIKVYQDYVNYFDNRYSRKYKGVEVNDPTYYWTRTIGPAQQKVPAWFIYAFCESGDYVAWTKSDFNKKVIRQTDKNWVTRWMKAINEGDGWYRGFEVTKGAEVFHRYLTNKTANVQEQEDICLRRELKNTKQLVSKQIEELNKLKILFENELKPEVKLNFK